MRCLGIFAAISSVRNSHDYFSCFIFIVSDRETAIMLDLQSRVLQQAAVFSELSRAAAEIDWFATDSQSIRFLSMYLLICSILSFATIAKVGLINFYPLKLTPEIKEQQLVRPTFSTGGHSVILNGRLVVFSYFTFSILF